MAKMDSGEARERRNSRSGAESQGTDSLRKSPTGIEGFDQITSGGLPKGRTTLIIGGPGTGKTIFALQALVNGAKKFDEPGIFVAFEENSRQVIANATGFDWDLARLTPEKIFFLDARLSPEVVRGGDFDLTGILAAIKAKADEMGLKRIVFDGIDVLLTLLDDPVAERREIYRLHDWLLENDLTGMITAKLESENSFKLDRYGFMQFMVDCVVLLSQRLTDGVSIRSLRVVKYRGTGFSANEFPLAIFSSGLEVAFQGSAELDYSVPTERVSTGIERLDYMLSGGYYRGSSVLISGGPGTAKTTLAATFVLAACRRGERSLLISFDEPASQIVRNLISVGIDLEPYVKSGLLRMASLRTEALSAEEHFIYQKGLLREHQPQCMVIDPISALAKAGGRVAAVDVSLRLLDFLKARGTTVLCTSLVESSDPTMESTATAISTIADTWIQLSYVVRSGERNRALTIIKSRGMQHSNQVRELVLASDGVTLADVYTAGGEVLMGTARWEKESQQRAQQMRSQREIMERRRQLELLEAETSARIAALQRELEARKAELATLEEEAKAQLARLARDQAKILELRHADRDTESTGDKNKKQSI